MVRNDPLVAFLSKEDNYWKAEGPHGVGVGATQEEAMDDYMNLVEDAPLPSGDWVSAATKDCDELSGVIQHMFSNLRTFLPDDQAFDLTKMWFQGMFSK